MFNCIFYNFSLDGAIYLSVEDQKSLPYMSSKKLLLNKYTRKNIGYLYAIHVSIPYIILI